MKIFKTVSKYEKGVRAYQRIDVTVADAIEQHLDNSYADGSIERLQDLIHIQQKFIAALVQRLYDTDRISAEFIKEHLDYQLTVED